MRFAYADPPYVGQARKHYKCAEVDHYALLRQMVAAGYDGWALSCSSPSLFDLAADAKRLAPECRAGSWTKPFAVFKPGVNPAYAWEPVIFWGGRKRTRKEPTVRDWHSANITLKKGLAGAKPESFCAWILDLLGVREGDELHDLFPGTRVMERACAPRGVVYVASEQQARTA